MVLPESIMGLTSEDFRICGKISIAVKMGKNVYAFKCTFCAAETCLPFLSFENYAMHIEEYHSTQYDISLKVEEDDDLTINEEFLPEINTKCVAAGGGTHTTQLKERTSPNTIMAQSQLPDPLHGPPVSAMAEVPSTFTAQEDYVIIISDCEDSNMTDKLDDNHGAKHTTFWCIDNSAIPVNNDHESSLSDRRITSAIIAGYKKHRFLWDGEDSDSGNRKKRQEALSEITHSVNERLGLRLKMESVTQHIRLMRQKFCRAMEKLAKTTNKKYIRPWYYNQMEFLISSLKCNRRSYIGSNEVETEVSILTIPVFSDSQSLELIEIYESFPCLWNEEHIGYHLANQQEKALDEMIQEIRDKMCLNLSPDVLKKIISNMQYVYSQEKRRKLQCERVKEEFKPYYKFYDNINFLEQHVGPFKCPYCGIALGGVNRFKIHKSRHNDSKPFSCSVCNQGFLGFGTYRFHLRNHTGDYSCTCRVCGKQFANDHERNTHMSTHAKFKFVIIAEKDSPTQSTVNNIPN